MHILFGLGKDIDRYELQRRAVGGNWVDSSNMNHIVGTLPPGREVQTIRTRADALQTINNGYFRLSLEFEGLHDMDLELGTMTEPIPFDASSLTMKTQLENLMNIKDIDVIRGYSGAHGHIDGPDPQVSDCFSLSCEPEQAMQFCYCIYTQYVSWF